MKSQKAKVYLREGLWVAKTEDGKEHTILDQYPSHARLDVARDDGRQALVEVLDDPGGTAADFKDFVR